MKKKLCKLVFIAVVFSLISCAEYQPLSPVSFASSVSYAPFIKKGYFVTESNSVGFDYEALGSLYSVSKGGYTQKNPVKNAQPGVFDANRHYQYVGADLNVAFEKMIKELEALGGNAIINLKITYTPKATAGGGDTYSVTGMAVKRK